MAEIHPSLQGPGLHRNLLLLVSRCTGSKDQHIIKGGCESPCCESKHRRTSPAQLPLPPAPGAAERCGTQTRERGARVEGQEGACMPWRGVGRAHTQRERTKTSKGKGERNTEASTYNRKQRNFTCSVVLMHQSTDRERDRQMERRRACEKTPILTLLWRRAASCPALSFRKIKDALVLHLLFLAAG